MDTKHVDIFCVHCKYYLLDNLCASYSVVRVKRIEIII